MGGVGGAVDERAGGGGQGIKEKSWDNGTSGGGGDEERVGIGESVKRGGGKGGGRGREK